MSAALDIEVRLARDAFALDATFQAPAGLTALFGRSGAGKTSLVDVVAGLISPEYGRIVVGGETLLDTGRGIALPAHRRRIGYVFQDARLFPHLSVRANLSFGRWFARERASPAEFARIVEMLGLGHLLKRRPGGLSGGERQRVAIGRALLANPRLLLMDEPLASLDEARKAEILPYVERLRDEAGIPIVYVSHAVAEVARLATTIVLLDRGRVTAAGPASRILMGMDGAATLAADLGALVEAVIRRHDKADGLTELDSAAGPLVVPRLDRPVGTRLRIRIPSRDVTIALDRPARISTLNILGGQVRSVGSADSAGSCLVALACGEAEILARITCRSAALLDLRRGTPVHALVKGVAVETP